MKRLFALLLAVVMLFSVTACNVPQPNPCETGHVDEDDNKKCDRCGADVPGNQNPDDPSDDSYLAPTISDAIMAQLEAAGSMKMDMSLDLDFYSSYYITYDEEGTVLDKFEDVMKGEVTISLVLSKTEKGINAAITMKSVETSEDEPYVDEMSIYLIDGTVYTSDEDLDAMVAVPIPSYEALMSGALEQIPAVLVDAINQLMDGLELTDEQKATIKSYIGKIITDIFEIKELSGSFNVDYKPAFDSFAEYINGIDTSKKTFESLVDDLLHLIDEELTLAKIIGETERIANLTLAEGLAEIDAWLTENYETTVQGIYDKLVNDEQVESLVRLYLNSMGSEDGEPVTEEDVEAFLAELRALKIEDLIKSVYPDLEAVTVYEAIAPIFEMFMAGDDSSENEEEYISDEEIEDETEIIPVNTLFGAIKDFFAMTLAQATEEYGMPDFITEIKEAIAGFKINALSTSASISFSEGFAISEISLGYVVDVEMSAPCEYDETKTEEETAKIDFSFKISAISNDTVEITLPKDTETVFGIWAFASFCSDAAGLYELDLYCDSEENMLLGDLYTEHNYISLFNLAIPTEKQDSYTFSYEYYAEDSFVPVTGQLTITFDYEALTYTVDFLK